MLSTLQLIYTAKIDRRKEGFEALRFFCENPSQLKNDVIIGDTEEEMLCCIAFFYNKKIFKKNFKKGVKYLFFLPIKKIDK